MKPLLAAVYLLWTPLSAYLHAADIPTARGRVTRMATPDVVCASERDLLKTAGAPDTVVQFPPGQIWTYHLNTTRQTRWKLVGGCVVGVIP